MIKDTDRDRHNFKPLIAAGMLLGIGLGGFFDGILFHQILQVHNMLSHRLMPDTVVNLEINMFWDGIFHAFTWFATVIGIALLWNAVKRKDVPLSTSVLVSSASLGWGSFNLIEGLIDHKILELHHVVERATLPMQLTFDLLFLASGIVLVTIGLISLRRPS